jgi:DNA repair protein RecO (recombination protein O)
MFLILFELALLKNVGLQPILQECTNCKRDFSDDWGVVYFSSMKNGIVCRDCEASFSDKVRIRAKTANCLANLKQLGNSNLDVLLEIEKVLLSHFTEILHKRPKMAKFVLEGASK